MASSSCTALLLLLNMAGTLLASRLPTPAITDTNADIDFFFFPFLVLYKSGRVERFIGTDTVPASTDLATGVTSRDVVIDRDTGLAVRLYLPNLKNCTQRKAGKLPVVLFVHGGAFVVESAFSPTYQRYLNSLVLKAEVLAVSVDYRLSPEHRLPTCYDDAWAALQWVLKNCQPGGEPWLAEHGDLTRLFLAGDSAGGNIAHNMAMRAGREGLAVEGVALLDPYFWGKQPVPSETRDAATRRWQEATWEFVCAGKYSIDHPVINPLSLPPAEWRQLGCARALVTVAGMDELSGRGRAYVEALRASGWAGAVELYETEGEGHVYFLVKPDSAKAVKEMEAVVAFINGDRVGSGPVVGDGADHELAFRIDA